MKMGGFDYSWHGQKCEPSAAISTHIKATRHAKILLYTLHTAFPRDFEFFNHFTSSPAKASCHSSKSDTASSGPRLRAAIY